MTDFWTDERIYQEARKEWIEILLQLWEAIGKPINPKQLRVYVKQLGSVPMAILEDVIGALLREHTWNNVPTLGEIWACLVERHGDPGQLVVKTKPCIWRIMGEGEEVELVL